MTKEDPMPRRTTLNPVTRAARPHPLTVVFSTLAVALLCLATPAPAQDALLGVSMPSYRESRWEQDFNSIREATERANVPLIIHFAGNSQEMQNFQIEEMVMKGVKILFVVPHNVNGVSGALRLAREKGVIIVGYDRLPMDSPVDAYLTFDNVKCGELQGAFLTAAAPKGDYILMSGPNTDSNSAEFKNGAMKHLQPLIDKKDIRVLTDSPVDSWQPSAAKVIVQKALTAANGRVDAVLAPNDDTAGAAIEALAEWKLDGKVPVTGMDGSADALQRVREGVQSMTVLKDTSLLAQKALEIALAMLRKEALPAPSRQTLNGLMPVPTYLLEPRLLTAEQARAR